MGKVTFGDNVKGKLVDKWRVGKLPNSYNDDVLLVEALKHNLLSINQFLDKGNKVTYNTN